MRVRRDVQRRQRRRGGLSPTSHVARSSTCPGVVGPPTTPLSCRRAARRRAGRGAVDRRAWRCRRRSPTGRRVRGGIYRRRPRRRRSRGRLASSTTGIVEIGERGLQNAEEFAISGIGVRREPRTDDGIPRRNQGGACPGPGSGRGEGRPHARLRAACGRVPRWVSAWRSVTFISAQVAYRAASPASVAVSAPPVL